MKQNNVREALRIVFLATLASMANPNHARAEGQAASFKERWPAPASEPFRCGGLRAHEGDKPEPVDDYKTVERKERARIKALLAD